MGLFKSKDEKAFDNFRFAYFKRLGQQQKVVESRGPITPEMMIALHRDAMHVANFETKQKYQIRLPYEAMWLVMATKTNELQGSNLPHEPDRPPLLSWYE